MLRPAGLIGPIAMLAHQTLKPYLTCGAKQIRADLV
jgi:hypothetical protein